MTGPSDHHGRNTQNTNNVISDDLTAAEKKKIAQQAGQSRNEPYWKQVLW